MYGVCRDFDQLRPKHSCSVEVGGKNAHFYSIILGLACLHVGQAFTGTALFPQATSRGPCVGVGPAVTMGRLKAEYPEVTSGCCDFKFKGRGQRGTPVTCVRGIVEIVMLLPRSMLKTLVGCCLKRFGRGPSRNMTNK